ncbi:MAG: hypothetical protein WDZ73_01525 [Candidatus Paceibacterota bacterium]
MNEFTAKKLGEVMAFINTGASQFLLATDALVEVLGQDFITEASEVYDEHKKALNQIVLQSDLKEVILTKAEKTEVKLKSMSDLYMQKPEDWQDPAEVIEWLGFFEGGAIVHFKLAEAAAEQLGLTEIIDFASKGVKWHQDFLLKLEQAITVVAKKRSSL